jgi:hypothetical protein
MRLLRLGHFVNTQRPRQPEPGKSDLISLISFFQNKESRLNDFDCNFLSTSDEYVYTENDFFYSTLVSKLM